MYIYIVLCYSGGACGCLVTEAQFSSHDIPSEPLDLIPLLDHLAVADIHHEQSDSSNQVEAQPLRGPHSLEKELKKSNGTRQ